MNGLDSAMSVLHDSHRTNVRSVLMSRRPAKSTPANAGSAGERVRAAATRLFAERGFAKTSMRELASAAGMSLSGLYHHFPSKDELLFELQRDAYERLMRPLGDVADTAPPVEKLKHLVQNHLRFFAADITAMKVLSHEGEALDGELGRRTRRMRRTYYRHCLGIVTALFESGGKREIDPRIATMTLFGMINWIYTWYRPGTDGPPEKLATQMVEIFLNGINKSP
jgi:AcrR family transcriptional regulator